MHAACAPAVLNRLLEAAGADPVETEPSPEGAQLKVNMLLSRLPRLRDSAVDPRAAFAGTFHVNEGYGQLQHAFEEASAGRVPEVPPCEIYCHSLSDRSILGPELAGTEAQTLTLFGLHLPARLFAGTEQEHADVKDLALARTLSLAELGAGRAHPGRPAPSTATAGRASRRAPRVELEADLGLPGGNIFHRSLQWPWAEQAAEVGTWGVETQSRTAAHRGSRRTPRWWGQRHTRSQRGPGRPGPLSCAASLSRTSLSRTS